VFVFLLCDEELLTLHADIDPLVSPTLSCQCANLDGRQQLALEERFRRVHEPLALMAAHHCNRKHDPFHGFLLMTKQIVFRSPPP
jgi:hypothetical protein